MLRGDLELFSQGISEWFGLDTETYEAEAASTVFVETVFMLHKYLKSKFEKPGR